eukprot:EG_transcript_16142
MDLYALLGVDRNVNARELKKAYRQKALEFHPDKNPAGEQMFKQINQAYSVLSGVKSREEYDRKLQRREGTFTSGAGPTRRPPFAPGAVNVQDIIQKDREMARRRAELKQVFGLDPTRSVRLQTLIRRQREELGLWPPQAARAPPRTEAEAGWEEKRRRAEAVRQEELRKAREKAEAEAARELQEELRTRRHAEDRDLRSDSIDGDVQASTAAREEAEGPAWKDRRRSGAKAGPRPAYRRPPRDGGDPAERPDAVGASPSPAGPESLGGQPDWDVECTRCVADLRQLHRQLQMQSNVLEPPPGLDRRGLIAFLRSHRVQVELAHAKYQADVLRLENKVMEGNS